MRTCTQVQDTATTSTYSCDVVSTTSPISVDAIAIATPLFGILFILTTFTFIYIFRRT